MSRESQDARDARAARRDLDVAREVTGEIRCHVRDAIEALDSAVVGETPFAREQRVRALLERALTFTESTVVARRIEAAAKVVPRG